MKTLNEKWMVLALVFTAACSPTSPQGEETGSSAWENPPGIRGVGVDPGAMAGETTPVEVRIRGENRGDYNALLLRIRGLEARVNGQPLQVTPGLPVVDLANDQQAWLVGTFNVPLSVGAVDLSLQLDDFGGFERATSADWFDSRLPPIRVTSPVKLLAERGHVVLHVDVQRSVMKRAGRPTVLLPAIAVHY